MQTVIALEKSGKYVQLWFPANECQLFFLCLIFFLAGSSEDGKQRAHKPEGRGSGWIRRTVQDKETHAAHQTDEGVLRETGGPGRVLTLDRARPSA